MNGVGQENGRVAGSANLESVRISDMGMPFKLDIECQELVDLVVRQFLLFSNMRLCGNTHRGYLHNRHTRPRLAEVHPEGVRLQGRVKLGE